MKTVGVITLLLVALSLGVQSNKADAQMVAAKEKCPHLVKGVKHYIKVTREQQKRLGERAMASSYTPTTSCKYTKWVLTLWKTRAEDKRNDLRYFSNINHSWKRSVNYADHVFPGTKGWLLRCSSGEGRHGPWIWNGGRTLASNPYRPSGSSGVGGWMQFMESTYYGFSDQAFASAKRRGFNIPPQYNHWYSAIGQAITAAYVRHDLGIGTAHYHWAPSLDAGCR